MKTAIVYYSFLGSTKHYAHWLSNKIKADLYRMKEIYGKKLENYDQFIIMSGTYAGQMPINKYLQKNWEYLKDSNVIAIAVGAAPLDDEQIKLSFELIPESIRSKIKFFKLPGQFFSINRDNVKPENLDIIMNEVETK